MTYEDEKFWKWSIAEDDPLFSSFVFVYDEVAKLKEEFAKNTRYETDTYSYFIKIVANFNTLDVQRYHWSFLKSKYWKGFNQIVYYPPRTQYGDEIYTTFLRLMEELYKIKRQLIELEPYSFLTHRNSEFRKIARNILEKQNE